MILLNGGEAAGVLHSARFEGDDDCKRPASDIAWVPSCTPTELNLRHCREIVGPFQGLHDDGRTLRVQICCRILSYPLGSDEAKELQEGLRDVPPGTIVGVLYLVVDGKPKLFVKIKEKKS